MKFVVQLVGNKTLYISIAQKKHDSCHIKIY